MPNFFTPLTEKIFLNKLTKHKLVFYLNFLNSLLPSSCLKLNNLIFDNVI
jgi:hypothetical protein